MPVVRPQFELNIPSPPNSALQIINACTDPKVNSRFLADLVSTDPALTAELLRIVNSAFYALSNEVQSIAHAVSVIGQRALRNLVLCISVRDTLRSAKTASLDASTYMDDALRSAVNAKCLGEIVGIDAHECFTAGIMQNFSVLVMFHSQAAHAPQWEEFRAADPDKRYLLEQRAFGITHDKIGMIVANDWHLPEDLTAVMGFHHPLDAGGIRNDVQPLCRISHCAEWMTTTFTSDNKRKALDNCIRALGDVFDISAETSRELLEIAAETLNETAISLGMRINEPINYEDVMLEANKHLAEENLSYQDLVWKLEHTLAERDRLAEDIQKDLEMAREIQQGLLPVKPDGAFPVTGTNIPARDVSGDFYDFYTLDDGRIYFNIADVSGKGMNAALLMAKTSSLFRCLGKTEHNLGKLLSIINKEICETSTRGKFVSMIAGIFDPVSRKLQIINAGHPPALQLISGGSFKEISANAAPLGISSETQFESINLDLGDDSLYLYTDGLSESRGKDSPCLKSEALHALFRRLINISADARLPALFSALGLQYDNLHDDITLLVID
ncbi:MAG: hypothetical protein BMS9Abin26_0550 [Gammaproteobacteria bacterium]|nr:MAG: hypothetical protein BMS9Abin26_0550 [Gammaproteobacteria bacterium]